MKRFLLLFLVLLCLGFIGYVIYTLQKDQRSFGDPLSIVPTSISAIVECDFSKEWALYGDWMRGLSSEQQSIDGVPFNPAAQWSTLLDRMDSLRKYNEGWADVIKHSPVFIVCPKLPRGDQWAIISALDEKADKMFLKTLMQAFFNEGAFAERTFGSSTIFEKGKMSFALHGNCLVIASSSVLMEDIVKCDEKESLREHLDFKQARATSAQDLPIHFYFPYSEGGWMALDPEFSSERKIISGYIVSGDSLNSSSDQDLASAGIANIIPKSVSILDDRNVGDFQKHWTSSNARIENTDKGIIEQGLWASIGDSCSCDLNAAFLDWRSGEYGAFVAEVSDSASWPFYYYGVKDSANAILKLRPLLGDSSTVQAVHPIKYPLVFQRNGISSVLVEPRFVMQIGGYLVAAQEEAALNWLLEQILKGESLMSEVEFKRDFDVLQPEGGRFFFQRKIGLPLLSVAMERIFSGSSLAANVLPFDSRKQFINITLPDADFKGRIQETVNAPMREDVLWRCALQAKVKNGPWVVTNHNSGDKEVLVQDVNNIIYLIGGDGKILWKKEVGGQVMGDVHQVDLLKNGKLQLIFNTVSSIQCMDRNGKNVEGYPIALSSSATCAMSIFDYEGNRSYRFLVACEDGKIYNYSGDAKKTDGWNYKPFGQKVVVMDHIRLGKEDYILTVGDKGKVELLKRTGQVRFTPKAQADDFANKGYVVLEGLTIEETRFIYPDNSGKIIELSFGKNGYSSGLTGLSEGAHILFADINSDKKEDFIVADGNLLRVFDSSREKIFETSLNGDIVFDPSAFRFNSVDWKISVTDSKSELYLFNTKGEMEQDYPRKATTKAQSADFNRDKKPEIVAGDGASVVVYRSS